MRKLTNWGGSRAARLALIYAGIVLAAAVLVLILGLTLIDWNVFKGPIERAASMRLGRSVTISGPLEAHVWSRTPTVTVEGLRLGGPPWEPDRPVAEIKRAQIQLQALSLLRGHLVLRRVELDHPVIYLHQEKSGRANWTFENKAPSKARASRPASLPAMRDLIIRSGKLLLVDDLRRLKVNGTVEAQEKASHEDAKPFRVEGKGTINAEPFKLDVAGGPLRVLSPDHPYPFSLAIQAGQNEIKADGKVLKPFDLAAFELQVDARGRDLAELFYLTQITLPNTPPFKLHADIARDGMRVKVTKIAGSLGGSDMSGGLDIDASTKRPLVKAELLSRHLFLKDFAAITGSRAQATASLDKTHPGSTNSPIPAKAQPEAPKQLFPDAHLQVDRLRAIDADVQFRATSIEAGSVPFKEVRLRVRLNDGTLALEPIQFEMAQGRLSGTLLIDGRSAPPQVHAELRAEGIQLAQFKAKGPGAVPPLDGVLDARAVIEGRGDSVHNLMSVANGRITAIVPNGDIRSAFAELTGVDVAKGIGLLLKKPDDRASIRCGVAQFDLQSGTAHVQELVLDTQNVLVTGGGQIDLRPEKLDLTLQGDPKKFRLVRVRAPVQIRGVLLRPSFRLESGHLLKQGAAAAALGSLLTPLAAILAFVDPGLAKDQNCAQLLAEAQPGRHLASGTPENRGPSPEENR